MSRLLAVYSLFIVAFFCTATLSSAEPAPDGPYYEFAEKRSAASTSDAGATITIESPTGIGSLEVKRLRAKWPAKLTLRIAIKGMEGLTLRAGDLEIRSFLDAHTTEVRQRDAQGIWDDTKANERHAVSIVRREKVIEVVVPAILLEANSEKLLVSWVDFYRG